jgi:hypothetical protein
VSGSFGCDRVEHMVPDQAFRFHRRGTFLLGHSPLGPPTGVEWKTG